MSDVTTEELVAKARQQGFITCEEIYAVFPDVDNEFDDIDAFCQLLADQGVEIVAAAPVATMSTAPEPEAEAARPSLLEHAELTDVLYDLYMLEIRQVKLLTAEEEVMLAKQIRQGQRAWARLEESGLSASDVGPLFEEVRRGHEARHRFIEANLRLVASVARYYGNQGLPILDLVQEGNIGLMRAVERWDYRLGYRFSTYATWWIRQAITRALEDQGRLIRLPVHLQEAQEKVKQAARELEARAGSKPTPEQIAEHCGMSRRRVAYLLQGLPRVHSLDSLLCCPDFPLAWDPTETHFLPQRPCPVRRFAERCQCRVAQEDGLELPPCLARLPRPNQGKPKQRVDYSMFSLSWSAPALSQTLDESLRAAIDETLSHLSSRQRDIIRMRFGLDGEEKTLEEVGQRLGVTRERVRQIQEKAIKTLKHPTRSSKLRSFLTAGGE